jgi:penicillin-binding protein-related factor A (putative recombinase)
VKGKEFEQACIYTMEGQERLGEATMSRYGVQASFVDGEWRPIHSLPDFEGILRGGRQFVFECKVCSQASFPLDDDKFKRRQLRHMLVRSQFGAITFLLIHFTERELSKRTEPARTVAFPVFGSHRFWQAFDRGEEKRINRAACDEYAINVTWEPAPRGRTDRPNILEAIKELSEPRDVAPF